MKRIICILKLKLKRKFSSIKRKFKKLAKKVGVLNFVLICVGLFLLRFNYQMIELFRLCGSIPETYACAVIAALLGECGICGWIKNEKEKTKREKEVFTNPDNMNNK